MRFGSPLHVNIAHPCSSSLRNYNSLTEEKTEGGAALPLQKRSDNDSAYMFSCWNNIVEIQGVVSAWWQTVTIICS
jgi:hypothetical protein